MNVRLLSKFKRSHKHVAQEPDEHAQPNLSFRAQRGVLFAQFAPQPSRRTLWRIVIAVFCVALLFWGGLVGAVYYMVNSIDYPGATRIASQTLVKRNSNLVIRRDASYRTNDEFNLVYNWYSAGFKLGPESYGQSSCILMAKSSRVLLRLEQNMSVMLCNTPTGRMAFVMREFTLRYPDWLRRIIESA